MRSLLLIFALDIILGMATYYYVLYCIYSITPDLSPATSQTASTQLTEGIE